jgi:hypothetical protein
MAVWWIRGKECRFIIGVAATRSSEEQARTQAIVAAATGGMRS